MKKIDLLKIVRNKDFQKELNKSAELSNNHRESGFCCYTDENFEINHINKAIVGYERSIASDMTLFLKHEKGKGFYIPQSNYRMVHVHFHPKNSSIIPSRQDLLDNNKSRIANLNLRDGSSAFHKEIYDKHGNLTRYSLDIINPIGIIGLVKDSIENFDLLIYQEGLSRPLDYELHEKSFGKISWNLQKGAYDHLLINVTNKKISSDDLKKLNKFRVIQTNYYPNEFDS